MNRTRIIKDFSRIHHLILIRSEVSANPLIRLFGSFLRVNTDYFPKAFLIQTWCMRRRKSYLSWVFFKGSAFLGQIATFLYPAKGCRNEKTSLNILRSKYPGDKGYSKDILVSVFIPTFNRCERLTVNAIPSVLNQTHKNIELIVVGDHCTDATEEKMRQIKDDRVKFINMPKQGDYPEIELWRWLVAGGTPANEGLKLTRGSWITNLDDDILFTPTHIEEMLRFALANDLEVAHGLLGEKIGESTRYYGGPDSVTNCTVLHRNYIKIFNDNMNCWKINEPADGNRWKRMRLAGAKIGFYGGKCGVFMLEKQQVRHIK